MAKNMQSEDDQILTLGQAKDRIHQLTLILARKEYQLMAICKEKEYYERAFQETL